MVSDTPPRTGAAQPVTDCVVDDAESGQKLLQFLERRLALPRPLLHRWIRTGQIRCNSSRCKPFQRIEAGDRIRLPPFAVRMSERQKSVASGPETAQGGFGTGGAGAVPRQGACAVPFAAHGDLLAVRKPAGLPVHPGTGHEDSFAGRLESRYAGRPFMPTPVHRLDKDTSGLLLVAQTYAALRAAHEAIRAHAVVKEYLAWVKGRWPYGDERLIRHEMVRTGAPGRERMAALHGAGPEIPCRTALCTMTPCARNDAATLLLVRLITGRTHQIRVQTADMGHPVVGDRKYGDGAGRNGRMLLHAFRITLPDGHVFTCPPDWTGPWAVPMPLPATRAPLDTLQIIAPGENRG